MSGRLGLATVAVVVLDAVLLATGVVDGRTALVLVLLVEAPLVGVTVAGYRRTYRRARAGRSAREAWRVVVDADPLLRLVTAEARMFASLARWATRRHDVPPGAVPLRSGSGGVVVPVAMAAACVAELVVLHVLVPWPVARPVLDLLGLYGLLAVLGLAAGRVVRPHLLTSDGLVLRQSGHECARVAPGDVAAVVPDRRYSPESPVVETSADGTRHACLAGPDGTHVTVRTPTGVAVTVPSWPWARPDPVEVTEIRLALDVTSRDTLLEWWDGRGRRPAGADGSRSVVPGQVVTGAGGDERE